MLNRVFSVKTEMFESNKVSTDKGLYKITIKKETDKPPQVALHRLVANSSDVLSLPIHIKELSELRDLLSKTIETMIYLEEAEKP